MKRVWPDTEEYVSDWHLKNKLEIRLRRAKRHSEDDPLWQQLQGAFSGPTFWRRFCEVAAEEKVKEVHDWIDRWGATVEDQLERRPLSFERGTNYPVTTGGLEAKLEHVKQTIAWRRYGFKNRQRLDRLLMLIELEINELASETEYARSIRDWLLSNGGWPKTSRRAVTDPAGQPSLRSKPGTKKNRPRRPKKPPQQSDPKPEEPPAAQDDGAIDELPF